MMFNSRYLLAAMSLSIVAACSPSDEQVRGTSATHQSVKVIADAIVFSRANETVEAVGTARAQNAATIYPESDGRVTSINFVSGEQVNAGAVLARLDDAEERLAVAQAKVALTDAQQLLERYSRIDVDGAVSSSQIDAAKTAVEAAQINLSLSRERLAKRTIRAPFTGFVGLTDIDVGARVTTGTEITRIDRRDILFVDFSVPEQVFGRVSIGDRLTMQPFASAQVPVEGIVKVVDSRIDPTRRTFTIRAEVDNSDDALRPGMSFRVSFVIEGNAYAVVPEASITWGGDGAYIWTVVDSKATRMPVTIVSREAGEVFIDSSLGEGDLIVVEGVQKVREGTPVEDISGVLSDRVARSAASVAGAKGASE